MEKDIADIVPILRWHQEGSGRRWQSDGSLVVVTPELLKRAADEIERLRDLYEPEPLTPEQSEAARKAIEKAIYEIGPEKTPLLKAIGSAPQQSP